MVTLPNVLRMNASTCLGFGALFSAVPDSVAYFLSSTSPAPSLVVFILGLGLISQSIHLFWASFQTHISKGLIVYFSVGDFAWALASLAIMLMGLWVNSALGMLCTSLVALMVSILGVMQISASKQQQGPQC